MDELFEPAPVFIRKAFTGQPETANEEVACVKCSGLVNLRRGGWFDRYCSPDEYPNGAYVHHACLSDKRKAELEADDLKHPTRPINSAELKQLHDFCTS